MYVARLLDTEVIYVKLFIIFNFTNKWRRKTTSTLINI